MSLVEYKRKRHFAKTPEPAGAKAVKGGRSFVIQKHQASHLHYDFRLELDGVLKSWAVPKGPNLDPSVKRLAMHVEDHPVEYGSFEGVIPQGEYGGGTVMLWDRGQWEPIGDPHEGYRTGRLKFVLHGEKLKGGWMLVRTAGRNHAASAKEQWLLFKERDAWARLGSKADIVDSSPLSVHTSRNLEEIAAERDWVWNSKANGAPKRTAAAAQSKARKKPRPSSVGSVAGAKAANLPERIDVQLATLVKEPPAGAEWLHEIKFDGYRMICRIDTKGIDFVTRNHTNWTARLESLAKAAAKLPVTNAILDGEVVALRADGTTDFQELQNAFRDGRADSLAYYVFDLLHLNGYDLTHVALEERKRLLRHLLSGNDAAAFHFSDHVEGNAAAFLKKGCAMHLEGIICKRRDSPYRAGRGYDWLKVKCVKTGEFVIGGYTDPTGARAGLGALLMGFHDDKGHLVYAGKVGTGFDDATLRLLQKQLRSLERRESPFADRKRATSKTHWVEPKLVAQVAFGSTTREGILRHASFQGLREDKAASEVTRDVPLPVAKATKRQMAEKARLALSATRRQTRADKNAARRQEVTSGEYDVQGETLMDVRLTSPDKVLYPEEGITKLELATYYRSIADRILPHIADRPLVLVRCPEGRTKECFFQKHPAVGTPDTLRQIPIREKNKTENYVIADDVAGLISLAQIGALEIHAWGSRADNLEYPDRLIFDLDPDAKVSWKSVVASAGEVRQFLKDIGLECFVKTTGGKGLHLVVPIQRRHTWPEAKDFCKRVAELIVSAAPSRYTANMSKAARPGKIFIDYLRNGRGATAVVPYSPRARAGATVSAPLTWKELTAEIHSDHFTIRNLPARLASLKRDPWEEMAAVRQGLGRPIAQLKKLPST